MPFWELLNHYDNKCVNGLENNPCTLKHNAESTRKSRSAE